MMIMSRPANCSRAAACDSSSDKLSGVVINADGSLRDWRARSAELVSPVRAPTVHSGASAALDSCSARIVSAASARIGVIHSTRRPLRLRCDASAPRSSAASHTA